MKHSLRELKHAHDIPGFVDFTLRDDEKSERIERNRDIRTLEILRQQQSELPLRWQGYLLGRQHDSAISALERRGTELMIRARDMDLGTLAAARYPNEFTRSDLDFRMFFSGVTFAEFREIRRDGSLRWTRPPEMPVDWLADYLLHTSEDELCWALIYYRTGCTDERERQGALLIEARDLVIAPFSRAAWIHRFGANAGVLYDRYQRRRANLSLVHDPSAMNDLGVDWPLREQPAARRIVL